MSKTAWWLLHAMILCSVCKQLVVSSIVYRFHNHGQQVRTESIVETPLTGAHLQSTVSVFLKMGILHSKDRPCSRSESRPSQLQLAQRHTEGNGLILPSHMQSQPTRDPDYGTLVQVSDTDSEHRGKWIHEYGIYGVFSSQAFRV